MFQKDTSEHILIVDDDTSICFILSNLMEQFGYTAEIATDGQEGMKHFHENPPDLVLLDIMMPEMNGFEVCEAIKAANPMIPVLMITALDESKYLKQAFEAGASDYVNKPFNFDVLRQRMAHLIERKHFEQAERDQRILAEALLDVAEILNSTRDLEEVLDRILINLEKVVTHDAANIMLIEGNEVVIVRSRGYDAFMEGYNLTARRHNLQDIPVLQKIIEYGEPLLISHIQDHAEWWVPSHHLNWIQSYAGAPIYLDDELTGFINMDSATAGFFRERHLNRLKAFTHEAAIAIRTARHFEQTSTLAALQERQRLARELHDAVSQTLFSALVTAESLSLLVNKNPEAVKDGLQQLQRSTRGALAEMRTLLTELRPTALIEYDMEELLRHLIDAMVGRIHAAASLIIIDEITWEPDDKHVFYRIAQESLNNIIKHARASTVSVDLNATAIGIILTISDNGKGFDPEQVPPHHLGLRIMQERAESINAALKIVSTHESGTQIILQKNFTE